MQPDELAEKLSEMLLSQKKERHQATEQQKKSASMALDSAISRLRQTIYGSYLLEKYPLCRTSPKSYPEANAVLRKAGSPAMTDGKKVYVDEEILADMLVQDYPGIQLPRGWQDVEDLWTKSTLVEFNKQSMRSGDDLDASDATSEIMDIILHELTHAANEHCKLSATAEARGASPEYMAKLAIACELQANDGIMGRSYWRNILQRQDGVTNKRLHPETAGCHTLSEFMDKIELNEKEKQQAQSKATAQDMNNTVRMAKATGEYKEQLARAKGQATGDEKPDDDKITSGSNPNTVGDGETKETTTEKVSAELEKVGIAEIKKLLLEALSDQLRYDPTTDSVFFDDIVKRVPRRTYARPSRRQTIGSNIIKKGTVYDRIHEPNKANKLTVLAVDASGSMTGQQSFVSAILDDLLEQAEKVAREHNLQVHYENLQCTLHRTRATKLVPATSQEWKYTMQNYHANGGNDFGCVLRAMRPIVSKQNYEAITVINLSDGLDRLCDRDEWGKDLNRYIDNGKLSWVDAIIANTPSGLADAVNHKEDDTVDIRKQVVLKVIHHNY